MNHRTTIACMLLGSLAAASAAAVAADNGALWSEEFNQDGPPDPLVWTPAIGNLQVNNELQIYTDDPSNVRVEDGSLVLTARRRESGTITSGRVRTSDKVMFQYGTVEARIKIPDLADGLWPAFWTLGNDISSVGWPRCGEIDILEMGFSGALANGEANRRVYSTAHWDIYGNYASYGESRAVGVELDEDYHIWRMEWTPIYIATYIDGERVWIMDISDPDSFGGHEFHAPHFFIVNLAVGGNFPGIYNGNAITAPLPAEYRVDWIRLYDNGHTILTGPGSVRPCPGDLTDDDRVDGADLARILAAWSTDFAAADLSGNGRVDAADIGLLLGAWGKCP